MLSFSGRPTNIRLGRGPSDGPFSSERVADLLYTDSVRTTTPFHAREKTLFFWETADSFGWDPT